MRYCDQCHTTYPNDFTVCPRDKSALRIASELMQGMLLRGKYEVLEKIGSGGMATVYKARHLAFNEIRAVKVVSSRFIEDDSFLKRFRNEAIISRKLQHPNAVRVDDLDETEDGRPFMVMEYVQGRDLRDIIHNAGPVPVERAMALGKQILSALAAAHALGIIHRDIKPDNILLVPQPDGSELIKILDFGIAKVREGAFDVGGGSSATKTGVVVGTPQYLSPEQAMGKHGSDVDARADLYSTAIVIYEMLTGRLPFESDTPIGILIKHIQTLPPPAHEVRPDLGIPKPISMILMKAMQKDRNDRFQSAEEMLEAMEHPEQWAAIARVGAQSATGRDDATAVLGSDFLASIKLAPARIPTPSHQPAAPAPVPLAAPAKVPDRAPAPVSPFSPVEPSVAAAAAPARPASSPQPASRPQPHKPAHVPPAASSRTWLYVVLAVVITAAALGGGGYWYIQKQAAAPVSRPAPTVPATPAVSDSDLQAAVAAALSAYPVLQRVQPAVTDGVVTLDGSVDTPAEAELAAKLAAGQSGVKDVRNSINFPPIAPVSTSQKAPVAAKVAEEPPAKQEPKPAPKPVTRDLKKEAAASAAAAAQKSRLRELLDDGERLTNSGAYAAAIDTYRSALDLDPNNAAAKAGIARARQAMETEQEILRRRK